ncbi:MAG TPA: hypothetical protein VMH27_04850 [Puia sp.]|nr:hypothetical protein [Puia sp.]
MRLYSKAILFARRLSVFYLLIGVFSVFFGIFYFKYLPANQAELDTRGFRILNQLARNLQSRDTTLLETFGNLDAWLDPASVTADTAAGRQLHLEQGAAIRQQIRSHVRFAIDSSADFLLLEPKSRSADSIIRELKRQRPDSVINVPKQGWSMVFHMNNMRRAIVRIGDFVDPVLAARDDLFDSYVLMEAPHGDGDRRMSILYLQKQFSPADRISADTALALQKNTDQSSISEVVIGGQAFELFIQSFELAGKRLEFGGLISKATYDKEVRTLPAVFIVSMVLTIFLGLMVLPFVKIFFISPGENMARGDVIRVILSVYLGTGVLTIIGGWFVASHSAQLRMEMRLQTISDKLESDIQNDLHLAELQMDGYIAAYRSAPFKKVLAYRDYNQHNRKFTDSAFSPRTYPLTARILWFDSAGNTLAKWNPFNFVSTPSSVTSYSYYDALLAKDSDDYQPLLDAGESNITSEFQFFLARRLQQVIHPVAPFGAGVVRSDTAVTSLGVLMPFYMHCELQPVLPEGFGFCLIDNRSMQVILHSDARRNLSENLFLETGSNARLQNCVSHRVASTIRGVDLYGTSHTLSVRPLNGQDLSLIVFYDDAAHTGNLFRLLHFTSEIFLSLAIFVILCLWLSTLSTNRPPKLSFELDRREWIRPVWRNRESYAFNWRYFSWLLWLGLFFFFLVWAAGWDIRIVYFISLLLPFYALWGFVAGRKSIQPRFPVEPPFMSGTRLLPDNKTTELVRQPNWFKQFFISSRFIVIALICLNWLIFDRIAHIDAGGRVVWVVVLFQAAAFAIMVFRFRQVFGWKMKSRKYGALGFSMAYVRSVFFSVLVMSMLPCLGVTWYAWTVEKVQYARSDELHIAGKNKVHMEYVARVVLQQTKKDVKHQLNLFDHSYPENLLKQSGRYLGEEDIRYVTYRHWMDSLPNRSRDVDEPYTTLLDDLFVITDAQYQAYSDHAATADSTWSFALWDNGQIELGQPMKADPTLRPAGKMPTLQGSTDPLFSDFAVAEPLRTSLFHIWDLGGFQIAVLLIIMAGFVWFLPRLMAMVVYRIFLLRFFGTDPPVEHSILSYYYPDAGGRFPDPDFKLRPDGNRCSLYLQEIYILETMLAHKANFEQIWERLTGRQRYFVYDFAADGYTNYKDSETVLQLYRMGVLRHKNVNGRDEWVLFSISFREFVLRKKGTPEIARLKDRYSVPGLWAMIRIPSLIIIAACAVLLLMTQENVTHRITVAVTSLSAIVPVVLEITRKITTKGS